MPIPKHDYPAKRADILPYLKGFCDRGRGRMSVVRMEDGILSSEIQCWTAWDSRIRAVCLTHIAKDDTQTCVVTHCSGDGMADWAWMINLIADWAREGGSERFEVIARPGWERVLNRHGLSKTHVILEMDL